MDNNNVRLSLSWRNVSNFENIKRLLFLHKFNNQTIKEEILSKLDPDNEHYFMITDTSQLLSIYSDIPREERMIGIHSLELFFSFDSESDVWLSLIGNELMIEITKEHLTRDFASEESGLLRIEPISQDNSVEIITDISEYILFNKRTNEEIFDRVVRILKVNNNSFKIYNKDITDSVTWLSSNETDGSILWVDNVNDAVILNRVSMATDSGATIFILMSDSGFVLYKREFESTKFGKLSEVSFVNDCEIGFAGGKRVEMTGGRWVSIDVTREEYENRGRLSFDPIGECNTACMNKPRCMGVTSGASTIAYTFPKSGGPLGQYIINVPVYNYDAFCKYYYKEPGQTHKQNVSHYKNINYLDVEF